MLKYRTYPLFGCSICGEEIEGECGYDPDPYPWERCCSHCDEEKVVPARVVGIDAMPDLSEDLQVRMIETFLARCSDETWVDRFMQRRRAYANAFADELLAEVKDNGPVVAPPEESK